MFGLLALRDNPLSSCLSNLLPFSFSIFRSSIEHIHFVFLIIQLMIQKPEDYTNSKRATTQTHEPPEDVRIRLLQERSQRRSSISRGTGQRISLMAVLSYKHTQDQQQMQDFRCTEKHMLGSESRPGRCWAGSHHPRYLMQQDSLEAAYNMVRHYRLGAEQWPHTSYLRDATRIQKRSV